MARKILSTFSLEIDDSRDATCKDRGKSKRVEGKGREGKERMKKIDRVAVGRSKGEGW
jgi:hypothetical protein